MTLVAISYFAVLACTLCLTQGALAKCHDPHRADMEKRWREDKPIHESFFQVPLFRRYETRLEDIERCVDTYSRQILHTPLGTDSRQCPYIEEDEQSKVKYLNTANGRLSLCPSHGVINFDSRRIPAILHEVECSCKQCALNCNGSNISDHSVPHILECIPVKYYTRVLRRSTKCTGETYDYKPVWEPLTLACECGQHSRPVVQQARLHSALARRKRNTQNYFDVCKDWTE